MISLEKKSGLSLRLVTSGLARQILQVAFPDALLYRLLRLPGRRRFGSIRHKRCRPTAQLPGKRSKYGKGLSDASCPSSLKAEVTDTTRIMHTLAICRKLQSPLNLNTLPQPGIVICWADLSELVQPWPRSAQIADFPHFLGFWFSGARLHPAIFRPGLLIQGLATEVPAFQQSVV